MRVLLIAPARLPNLKESKGGIPIPLLYLASALRARNHTPIIYDLSVMPGLTTDIREGLPEGLQQSINRFSPELFAINCFTTLHFQFVTHIAKTLRNNYQNIPIVVGGAHSSLFPKDILANCPYIDYIVVGEGEEQITQLADALSLNGSKANLSHIQSFAWRRDDEVIFQPRKSFVADLDELPDPAWDLINLSDYHSDHSQWNNPKNLSFKLSVPIVSSRGCPFACNFCAAYTTMGKKFRRRSPQHVVDEIQMLHEHYGENCFSFLDDNMNLNKKHILTICSEICKRGLNIEFETLSGIHIGSLDNEVIEALDQAGCVFVRLGIEHGNDRIRNEVIGKQLDREQIYAVCTAFKKFPRIRTASMFIMGFPEDTCETLDDTRKMILDLQLDLNQVFNLLPFPGTRVFEQASKDGLLLRNYNSDRLWAGETCLDPTDTESEFFLLPYAMTMKELMTYRTIFDNLRVLPNSRILKSSELLNKIGSIYMQSFEEQKSANILALGANGQLKKLSRLWVQNSGYHKYAYNFSWLGRPIIQLPQDIIAMQEIIWQVKPDLIIEIGIAHGGSLIFYASMLELLGGNGQVLGIDIDIRQHNRVEIEKHPMFNLINREYLHAVI